MRLAFRLLGTIIFTIVTASLYGGGLWLMGAMLWAYLPIYAAVPALLGLVIAPVALFSDLLTMLRADDAGRAEKG